MKNFRAGVLREASRRRGSLEQDTVGEKKVWLAGSVQYRCVHGAGERQNAHPDAVPRMVSYGASVARSGAGC